MPREIVETRVEKVSRALHNAMREVRLEFTLQRLAEPTRFPTALVRQAYERRDAITQRASDAVEKQVMDAVGEAYRAGRFGDGNSRQELSRDESHDLELLRGELKWRARRVGDRQFTLSNISAAEKFTGQDEFDEQARSALELARAAHRLGVLHKRAGRTLPAGQWNKGRLADVPAIVESFTRARSRLASIRRRRSKAR